MQNYIEKKLKVLETFLLILSLSVISFSQKNIEKDTINAVESNFGHNDIQNINCWLENDTLKVNEVNNFLENAALAKDTVVYLNALAVLQKKYFTTDYSLQLNQSIAQFDLNPYFASLESVLSLYLRKYYVPLTSIAVLLLFAFVALYSFNKNEGFLIGSVFSVLFLFLLLNVGLVLPQPKYFIYDAKVDLMSKPNYLSANLKNVVKKGEIMTLVNENDVWLEFNFKNQIYFVPRNQSPFLF